MNNSFIYLACLYRPPSENEKFWDILNENISLLKKEGDDVFCNVGDLNSNYYNRDNKVRNLTYLRNLKQLITQPTRIPSNKLLDPVITNSPLLVQTCGVLDPFCSDFKPVYVILKFLKNVWLYLQKEDLEL